MMQRGLIDYKPHRFILKKRIIDCLDLILGPARTKDITVCYDIPEDYLVVADIHMFETVIRNLVSNAIKFTPHGGKIFISQNMSMMKLSNL
jgi:two-component system, sensor histidine kinase and response regulator